MEKRKFIIIGIILFILGLILGYITCTFLNKKEVHKEEPPKEKENEVERTKYYINFFDETVPGTTYKLEMDKTGKYTLEVYNATSAIDVEPTTDKYNDTLTSDQLAKVDEILKYIREKKKLTFKEPYIFNYDYTNSQVNLSYSEFTLIEYTLSALDSISKKEEKIGDETSLEFGNKFLDDIVSEIREEVEEEKEGYTKIEFTNSAYLKEDKIKLSKDKEVLYSYKDGKIYLDNNETSLKTSQEEIYAVDIDSDGTNEIITRTMDNRISPPTNEYHIYEYSNNTFKEISTIAIMGTIDSFYIKENDIKVKYTPYEATPGYNKEAHFKIEY